MKCKRQDKKNMKELEIIRRIIEENNTLKITNFLHKHYIYNLTFLCILNKKYLNEENLKILIDNKKNFDEFFYAEYNIEISNISFLISKYPNLLYKISTDLINNFNNLDWAVILSRQPNLFDKCKIIDKFELKDWFIILRSQPQLSLEFKNLYNSFNINTPYNLISLTGSLSKYIDVNKINTDDLSFYKILSDCPEIVEKLNEHKLKNIPNINWVDIISNNSNLIKFHPAIDEFNSFIVSSDNIHILIFLVSKQPKFASLLKTKNINKFNLIEIIKNQPQLINKLKINFKDYDKERWIDILKKQPQFIDKCDKVEDIKTNEWSSILIEQPSLIKYCNKIDKISPYYWYRVIMHHPELINKNNIDLSGYKVDIIRAHIELFKKFSLDDITKADLEQIILDTKTEYKIKFFKKYIEKYRNQEFLTNMIGIYPDLKKLYTKNNLWKYVNFNKLTDNLEYGILK